MCKCVLSIVFVVLAVSARPQYNYNPPSISAPTSTYGVPSSFPSGNLVQKHVYVYEAAPEQVELRGQRPISVGQSRKDYKIIFIKAPSAPAPTVPIIPQQPQNEEKTIVYVLVKRPEEVAEITIPTAAPVQPSKPEVYFIRYNTQSQAVQGGVTPKPVYGVPSGGGSGLAGGEAPSDISPACMATLQGGCL